LSSSNMVSNISCLIGDKLIGYNTYWYSCTQTNQRFSAVTEL
jgi:hypothetical protein